MAELQQLSDITEGIMNINDTLYYLNIGLPEDILRRKYYGDFDGAIGLINRRLSMNSIPAPLRACLTAQREIIRRLPEDYPYTRAEALHILRRHISDFSEEEFDERVDAGEIGWIYVKGEPRYFKEFFPTLVKTDPDFARRAGIRLDGAEGNFTEAAHLHRMRRILQETGRFSNRIRIRASIRLKDTEFTPGMFLRVHLPIPSDCPEQTEIKIEKIYPENGMIAPSDAIQRTVCREEHMEENHPFVVEYSYVYTAVYHDISKMKADLSQPSLCTEEQPPHIVFTPYIRALAASLTEGLSDPLQKARAFYDFITLNMKYTFMPAYFVLENIPETCARNFSGDCGIFSLLFITLCRAVGIPAQWQSGMAAEPDFACAHDWARFYIAPYGWLSADPSYGVAAVKAGSEESRRFYFGNLDSFRMVANNGFQAPFTVPKLQWRADPYDNQEGEAESDTQGFNFSQLERCTEVLSYEEL